MCKTAWKNLRAFSFVVSARKKKCKEERKNEGIGGTMCALAEYREHKIRELEEQILVDDLVTPCINVSSDLPEAIRVRHRIWNELIEDGSLASNLEALVEVARQICSSEPIH